jgi:hypothetical protein
MKKLMIVRSKTAVAGLAFALATASAGRAAVIHVPADYPTIQAAVDAAQNHDTIRIAPGVYPEQVEIVNKNLTLSGSPGAVLRATPGMNFSLAPELGNFAVSLLGVLQSDVVVSGLTFEGQRLGDSQPGHFFGIWFFASGGRIEDCRISGIRSEALANEGQAFRVENPHGFGPAINVDVLRNTFADNCHSVVLKGDEGGADGLWDPETLRTTFTVKDNIIVGNGPDDTGVQYGILIWAGASGEVKRNIISDHACTGGSAVPFSYGILAVDGDDAGLGAPLAALQPMQFEGNILRNNQHGMGLFRGDRSMIVNNSFEGTAPGYLPGGLALSGEDVKVVANRFESMETGMLLVGLDPGFGTYFGIASNTKLEANKFCGVADPIVMEPQVTGTQAHGNQLDACH